MDEQNQNLGTIGQIQEGNVSQDLPYHTHNGIDSPVINVSEASLLLADITTGDATTSRHGLLPKLSGIATEFLDGTGDYDTVKESDLSLSDITTNDVSTSKHGLVPKAPNSTTKFLRGDATWNEPSISVITMTVTAGETLAAGDVVELTTKSGTIYAIRAAANDTTYGNHIIGMAYEAITIGNTGRVITSGGTSSLTGLSSDSIYYLSDYLASSVTISQTSQDTEFNITTTHVLRQTWTATESRLDKVVLYARKNGGGAANMIVELKRANTVLDTITTGLGGNSATLAEFTFDFTDKQIYKGETLNFRITVDTDFCYLGYKSGGNVYSGGDLILDSGSGTIAANSDAYMKVYENTNFGKVGTSAGTRKIKIGTAISATDLIYQLQYGDSIL